MLICSPWWHVLCFVHHVQLFKKTPHLRPSVFSLCVRAISSSSPALAYCKFLTCNLLYCVVTLQQEGRELWPNARDRADSPATPGHSYPEHYNFDQSLFIRLSIRIRSGGNAAAACQTLVANESPGNIFTRGQRDLRALAPVIAPESSFSMGSTSRAHQSCTCNNPGGTELAS